MNDFVSVKCSKCGESMYASTKRQKCKCANCGAEIVIKDSIEEDVSTEKLGKSTNKQEKVSKENKNFLNSIFSNTLFIIISLIIVFPLGLYLMWKNNKFDFVKRIILSVIFGIVFILVLLNLFGKDKEITNKKVSKATYDSIKKELGIEKEVKNGYSEKDNITYYFENYKFSIPTYYAEGDNNVFSAIEDDAAVAKISLVKLHDDEDTVTYSLLEEETKQGKMQDALKNIYGDVEILKYQSMKNDVLQGILYEFITTDRTEYFEQFVFGDDIANDWYYITFYENVNSYYEYNDDFRKVCNSITKIKKIRFDNSSNDYIGKNYQDVIGDLKGKGFTNIEIEPKYDLILGWLSKEGDYDEIIIDNKNGYSNGDEFRENVKIVVKYHAFPSSESTEEKIKKITGTYIGNKGSAITLTGDSAIYYYRPADYYEDNIKCQFDGEKYYLDIKGIGYKIYLDYSINAENPYFFKSDNLNWETEEFNKINNDSKIFERNEYDKMLTSSDVILQTKCQDLLEELKNEGFSNIKLIPNYDIYFGIVSEAGDIEQISINGNTKFDSYLDFDRAAEIQIKYHESFEKDPEYIESKKQEEESKRIEEENKIVGWHQVGDDWYYYNTNGKMAKSRWVDEMYYVDENGKMLKNTKRTILWDIYQFDATGKARKIEKLELIGGIRGTSVKHDYFVSYITGVVRNNTDKKYKYIRIKFNLYDSTGAKVGTASASINDIEPGGTWRFEAMAFDDFAKYNLEDLSGF